MQKSSSAKIGLLTFGWRVTPTLAPIYWLNARPRAGYQSDSDLVRVSASAMGYHAAIVAQSGSGKSFFLGRVVEEILFKRRPAALS